MRKTLIGTAVATLALVALTATAADAQSRKKPPRTASPQEFTVSAAFGEEVPIVQHGTIRLSLRCRIEENGQFSGALVLSAVGDEVFVANKPAGSGRTFVVPEEGLFALTRLVFTNVLTGPGGPSELWEITPHTMWSPTGETVQIDGAIGVALSIGTFGWAGAPDCVISGSLLRGNWRAP